MCWKKILLMEIRMVDSFFFFSITTEDKKCYGNKFCDVRDI